jgi:type III secretion system HrpE/YscL family protein
MTIMNIPLNRPVVSTLAQIDSLDRVIPSDRVQEIERIAARTVCAGEIISQAEAMCRESLDDQARAAWAQGVAQGRAEALAKLGGFVDTLAARRRDLDRELMDLVADAVTKIIREAPSELLTSSLIANALDDSIELQGRVTLRLHPSRVDIAEQALATHADIRGSQLNVAVTGDDALKPDDCVLESANCVIDASLSVQLDSLRSLLRNAV